jgi:hypothetical protein
MRIIGSPGLVFKQANITSAEKRADGTTQFSRLGGKSVDGSFNTELTVGGAIDEMIQGVMRSAWVAEVTITETEMTSITTPTTSTIVAAAGSWITEGVREGDLIRLLTHDPGHNQINLRAVTVTASTITVAGTPLTVNAVADTSFSLLIKKKIVTNTTAPTRYSYSVEQYDTDIDLSEVFLGCRVVGMRLGFRPGQMATATFTMMGLDRNQLATGTSPFFTTPTVTTGLGLISDDSNIYYNGAAVTTFTGFDLDFQITASGEPVIGSLVMPDIFDNDLSVTGTITGVRQDFSNLTLFSAGTEFAMGILLAEPGTEPVPSMSFWLPRVRINALSAPVGGGDGAKIETLELQIGVPDATTSLDATVVNICSTGDI